VPFVVSSASRVTTTENGFGLVNLVATSPRAPVSGKSGCVGVPAANVTMCIVVVAAPPAPAPLPLKNAPAGCGCTRSATLVVTAAMRILDRRMVSPGGGWPVRLAERQGRPASPRCQSSRGLLRRRVGDVDRHVLAGVLVH